MTRSSTLPVLLSLLLTAGCSLDCHVPTPGSGSPSVRFERHGPQVSVGPSSAEPPPAAKTPPAPSPPQPPPVKEVRPPQRSTTMTQPAVAPEGQPRDLPAPPDEVFARWNPERALQALQGSWLTPGNFLGTWHAWEVAGNRVRIYDGSATGDFEASLRSPCSVFVKRRVGGGFAGVVSVFTVHGSELWMGLGNAGYRRGNAALLCAHGRIYSTDGEGCVAYRPPIGDGPWRVLDTRCGFDLAEGGWEVFFFQDGDSEHVVYALDDVLASKQLETTHSIRQASFEAAKTARDAKQRSRP